MRDADRTSSLMARLVSPAICFPALWLLAVALSQIRVVGIQTPWSSTAWAAILLVPVAFVAGGAAIGAAITRRVPWTAVQRRVVPRRRLLIALVVVGYAELAREYGAAGAIPLLSNHIDASRVSIHPGALGLLVDALTVASIVAIATPPRLLARAALPELVIALVALGGFALSGGRQAAAIAVAGLVARVLFWGSARLRSIGLVGLLLIAVFGLTFYLRTGQEIGQAFSYQLYGQVVPHTSTVLLPFLPTFFSLAMNPAVLAHVVDYFPHVQPFGHGVYDAQALHAIVHAQSLGAVTQRLTAPWLVSTAAGPLWADGGFPAIVLGFILIGALTTAPYVLYRHTRRFAHALLAGYFASVALYCVYDNLLTQYKDWVFVAAGLLLVGRRVETEQPRETAPPEPTRFATGGPIAAAAATIALLALVVVLAERGVSRTRALVAVEKRLRITRVSANVWQMTVRIPVGAADVLRDQLVAAPQAGGVLGLWAFRRSGAALSAVPLRVSLGQLQIGPPVRLPTPVQGPITSQVGTWGRARTPAAFELVRQRDRLAISVASLERPSHMLGRATVFLSPSGRGARRRLAIARSNTGWSNLVVVDQGSPDRRLHVQIFSGASGFKDRQSFIIAGGFSFSSPAWTLLVGPVQSFGPDLVLLGSERKQSTAPLEAHVLLSSTQYRTLGIQTVLGRSVKAAAGLIFLPTGTRYPTLYEVDPKRGTLAALYIV